MDSSPKVAGEGRKKEMEERVSDQGKKKLVGC
jgi:hypothetical protein